MLQEHAVDRYAASVEDLLYFSFVGGAALSLAVSLLNGECVEGLRFLAETLTPSSLCVLFAFTSFSFLGATCSTGITAQHGALVNGLCNTVRKAATIVLSFALFPERNHWTAGKVHGVCIFFAGLLLRVLARRERERERDAHNKTVEAERDEESVCEKVENHALDERESDSGDEESDTDGDFADETDVVLLTAPSPTKRCVFDSSVLNHDYVASSSAHEHAVRQGSSSGRGLSARRSVVGVNAHVV